MITVEGIPTARIVIKLSLHEHNPLEKELLHNTSMLYTSMKEQLRSKKDLSPWVQAYSM